MKLLGCLCAVCAMAVVAAVGAGTVRAGAEIPRPPAPVLLGDADNNGRLTVADAVLVLKVALGLRAPVMAANSAATINVTDANEDGAVTIADAQLVLRQVLGLAKPRTIKWLPPTEPIEKVVFKGDISPVPRDAVPRFAGLPDGRWAIVDEIYSFEGRFLSYLEDNFAILYSQGNELLLGGWGHLMYLNLATKEKKVAPYPVGGEAVFLLEGGDILGVWSGEDADLACIQFKQDSEGDYLAVKWRYKLPVWEIPHNGGEKVIIIEGGSWMVSPNIVLIRSVGVVRNSTNHNTGWYERLSFCSVSSKGAELISELRLQSNDPDDCSWQYGVAFHQGYILLPLIKWHRDTRHWYESLTYWIPYDGIQTEIIEEDSSICRYNFGIHIDAGGFWPDPDGSVWEGYDGNLDGSRAGAEKGVARFRLQCVRE